MASLRQLGQNLLLTKDDGTTVTKVVKDKEEREKIKADFNSKGVGSVLEFFEPAKKPEVNISVKNEVPVEKPAPEKRATSGSYRGNER